MHHPVIGINSWFITHTLTLLTVSFIYSYTTVHQFHCHHFHCPLLAYCPRMRRGNALGLVCLSVYPGRPLMFESLVLETSFLVCRCLFRISRSTLWTKVIRSRSRSRSHEYKTGYRSITKTLICGWSSLDWKTDFILLHLMKAPKPMFSTNSSPRNSLHVRWYWISDFSHSSVFYITFFFIFL